MIDDVIRVVLADDHAVVRAGLKAVLGAAKDIEVVGEASNGREAVAMAERLEPHIVVMDLTMPDMDGVEATKALAAKQSDTRVLVLTMHGEDEYLVTLLGDGGSVEFRALRDDEARALLARLHVGRLAYHPCCAFEVDDVRGLFKWESVVVHGTFYLLHPDGADRNAYEHTLAMVRTLVPQALDADDPTPHRTVLFRIHANEITGRSARSRART